jgi:CRP-like cAMP-binding protein
MNALKEFFSKFSGLPEDSLLAFLKLASKKSIKKKDVITKTGEVPEYFYIIKSGLIRSFYEDEKGKEYTRSIFLPNFTTGALSSLLSGKPSMLTYECLTDCIVYEINFKKFKQLSKSDHAVSILYSELLEFIFFKMESKIYDLSVLDATERYLKLKQEIPNIENLITQYNIASYLNISSVQLSRIRKEIYSH